ncbi:MAG: hypothetical protein J5662_05955, partial [Clostridia bacterium]|nr:hypothetical protein [Clostridia bacterium]
QYLINFNTDDVLTVFYSDGSHKDYTAEFIDGEIYFVNGDEKLLQHVDVIHYDEQWEEHWEVNGSYTFYVEYNGFSTPVIASIRPNPVDEITYTPVNGVITCYFETGGLWDINDEAMDYYHYNAHERSAGDVLTVSYNDGRGIVDYVLTFDHELKYVSDDDPNDFIESDKVEMLDRQCETPYTLGGQNPLYVTYMGRTTTVQVDIVENPISALVYTPANDIVIYENANGEWQERDGQQIFVYYTPGFNADDQLAVTFADTGNTVIYTFLDYYDNQSDIYYNGFYDGNMDPLPDGELFTCYDGEWELGDGNFMYVSYMDNASNYVRVTIVENPVAAIRFERGQDVVIVENTHMYYDQWDDAYYYSIPYHEKGDRLIITDKYGAETVYDYQDNGDYTAEGQEPISSHDVWFNSNQRDNPWTLGENDYYVEYLGKQYKLTATIIENPVESFKYIPAEPFTMIEGVGGYFDQEYEYYHYFCGWFSMGDRMIVNYKDSSVKEYEYIPCDETEWNMAFVADDGSIITIDDLSFDDNQITEHWHVGDDNIMFVDYLGVRADVYVTITENNVKAIDYQPAQEPTVMCGVRSYVDYYTGIEMFDEPYFEDGDMIIVTDTDDNEKTYTAKRDEYGDLVFAASDGDKLDWNYLCRSSEQHIEPWTVGGGNLYYVEYCGAVCPVYCTVLENPVESIEFISLNTHTYYEGTNMRYDEWEERSYYNWPNIENGDRLIVHYSNPARGTVEYTAAYSVEMDRMTFLADNGERLVENYLFDYYDDQYAVPWEIGTNYYYISYCGKEAAIPVIITENNLAGFFYQPVNMPRVWEGDYFIDEDIETHEQFNHYSLPEFEEGDTVVITYTNEDPKAFTLVFDEQDGERYFVNGDQRFHEYEFFRFDYQDNEEWTVGTDNYYYIDFYGFITMVQVEVAESDVMSMTYTPVNEIVIEENQDGEYIYDGQGVKFYLYDHVRIINPGDTLTVLYKDGIEITYAVIDDEINNTWVLRSAQGQEIDTRDISIDDHQWDNHWVPGTNYFDVKYHGVVTSVPVAVNAAPSTHVPGDINGDGLLNNKDLTRLFQYLSDWDVSVNEQALDVNGDGLVNNKDLTRLFQYLSD